MLFIFLQSSIGLALLVSSVLKSPRTMSNTVFDVICGGLGRPALNYNFALQASNCLVCFEFQALVAKTSRY